MLVTLSIVSYSNCLISENNNKFKEEGVLMSAAMEYWNIKYFDFENAIGNHDETSFGLIAYVEEGFDDSVIVDTTMKNVVDNADSSEYRVESGISFFRERKDVLNPVSMKSDKNVDYIVITTQKMFTTNSKTGKELLELAKTQNSDIIEAKKQAQLEALIRQRNELDKEINELRES